MGTIMMRPPRPQYICEKAVAGIQEDIRMKNRILRYVSLSIVFAILLPMAGIAEDPSMGEPEAMLAEGMEIAPALEPMPEESGALDLPLEEETGDIGEADVHAVDGNDAAENTEEANAGRDEDAEEPAAVTEDAALSGVAGDVDGAVVADATSEISGLAVSDGEAMPETASPEEASAEIDVELIEDEQMKTIAEAAPAFPAALTLGVREKFTLTGGDGYTSSKPKVASVSANGVVTAKKKGSATITVTAGGNPVGTCQVTVKTAPKKITLPKKQTVIAGQSIILKAKVSGGYSNAITWTSSNPAVATVDANGFVTAVAMGKAKITARTYNKKKAACTVTVEPTNAPTSVGFPMGTLLVGKGESVALQPVLNPGAVTTFTYTAKNKAVATVDKSSGIVKGKKLKKSTKITVKTHNGKKATLTVKVVKPATGIALNTESAALELGGSAQLSASVPAGTASQIRWASSNPGVVTVSEEMPFSTGSGSVITLTAVGGGSATVTASTFNGKTASCQVTVNAPAPIPDPVVKPEPVVVPDPVSPTTDDPGVVPTTTDNADPETENTPVPEPEVPATVEPSEAVKQLATDLGLSIEELVAKSNMSLEALNALDEAGLAALKESLTPQPPVEASEAVKQLATDLGLSIEALVEKSGKSVEELNALDEDGLAALKESLTVGTINSVTIKFGETEAGSDAIILTDNNVTATWTIDGNADSCAYQIIGPGEAVVVSETVVESYSLALSAVQNIATGVTYTLKIAVTPTNGTDADIVYRTAKFLIMGDYKMEAGVVTAYTGNGGAITIPDVDYEGNSIVAIGVGAFKDNADITGVTIAATVTEIRESAFEGCGNLESVSIPNGVTTIGKAAFKNCVKLSSMSAFS